MKSKEKMFKSLSLRILVFILIAAISGPAFAQSQTLLSVDVTPANPTINAGSTQQFTATGTFSDGSIGGTWASAGSMANARGQHTATLLPNGKVLVAGGFTGTSTFVASATADLYDPNTGTWSVTGSMAAGRWLHTATLLPNGKVLVAGGGPGAGIVFASAELYDPNAGTWTFTGNMTTARHGHTATLLPSGKVLVAGGGPEAAIPFASAELYDPATGTWTATGSMTTVRNGHTATLLPNGKVLVAGGDVGGSSTASAELYDPNTGTWTATGSMTTARRSHTATLLPNGKVLVAGGDSTLWLASVELYDPNTGTWTATGSMANARGQQPTTTLLPNGKVLVAGGNNSNGLLASAELYDPNTGTWTVTGSMATGRWIPTATLLPNGKVLVTGGQGTVVSAELYTPITEVTATQLLTMPPPSGLVSWWPGDGNANDIQDGNNGTLMNGVTFAPGMVGQAFSLDGINDHVLISDTPSLNPTSAITLEAWVFVAGKQGEHRDIISKDGEGFDRQYELTVSTFDRFRAHINVGGTSCFGFSHCFDGSIPVQLNTWYHVAMTYDGSFLKLYVNGMLDDFMPVTDPVFTTNGPFRISEGASGPIITTTQPVRIGGGAPAGQAALNFPGLIDEAEIYNRALTATEIQAIFDSGTLGKCKSQSNCVTWSSSNPAVATIDANGLATGNSPGTSTITATSGTISGSTILTVASSDNIPPVITPTITPTPNAAGWNNSNVTVSWSVTDPESGISSSSGCTSTSLITETSGTVLSCVATNGAGLSNSSFVTIKIDKTPPIISASSSPLPNSAGWNNTNVTVSYTCSDSLSGISSCSSPTTATTEGSGQVIAGSAKDLAGNSAVASVTLNIDKTPPVVAISGVVNGATYTLGCAPAASFTASDLLSGVATSNGSLTGGNANGVGGFTYTANATDIAGNSTTQKVNYSVVYNFIGFLQPINSDGSSIFKLGSAVPIKYQLTDCNGVAITTSVGTLAVSKITDAVLGTTEEMTVDSSGAANTDNLFRYSAPNYIYNLDTKPYTSGTYRLQAILDDGTIHAVNVSLKVK